MKTRKLPGLRWAREERNLSQRGLEQVSGVSYVQVSRLEKGQRARPETAEKLAQALGVEVEELYEGFSAAEISDRKLRDLYKDTYVRLVSAERRAFKGTPTLFDEVLDDRVYELLAATEEMPVGEERKRLRDQVRKMARRTADVLMTEAEIEARRLREEAQKLRDASQELTGAA